MGDTLLDRLDALNETDRIIFAGAGSGISGATPPRFSTEEKEAFNGVTAVVTESWGVGKSEIAGRVNEIALDFYNKNNQRWPSTSELLGYEPLTRTMNVYVNQTWQLPPFFGVDGQLWHNDQLFGPSPIDRSSPAFADSAVAQAFGGVLGSKDFGGPTGTLGLANFRQIPRRDPETGEILLDEAGNPVFRNLGPADSLIGNQDLFKNVPNKSLAEWQQILVGLSPRGGGGGGGSAARPDLVFDRAQLEEQAKGIWRPMMLEEPDDVSQLVSGYLKEANSFWRNDGGRLDFATYVTNQARGTGRYANLYRRKPDFQNELEYMGGFQQTASSFGLSAGETLKQVEAGATSGASLTGFADRVSRGRENQLSNQGSFSQRFANNLNQLGGIGRS